MGVYYPQGIMTMRVILEDYGENDNKKLNSPHVFTVVCKSITVNLNSYREADTFDAEIDFKNFPFDPRTIRSAGVTIHIEDKKKLFKTNNANNLLKPTDESVIFQGFVDEDSINLDGETRVAKLKGRDFTSLLLDQEYLGSPINTAKPLDLVIRELLDQLPQTKVDPAKPQSGIKIDNKTGADLPTLANFSANNSNSKSGQKNGRKKRSYWDKIQELISDSGLIAYISLDKLIITKPRKLYDTDREKAKVFVYGANLGSLEFSRKLGRQKNINVRVLSLNVEKKKVIEALIPEQASESWAKDIGIIRQRIKIPTINKDGEKGEDKDAPFITFRVRDAVDFKHLVSVGEKVFEEIGRQQIEGSLKTKEMAVCTKEDKVTKSTLLRIGDAIEVSIDQGDLEGMPNLIRLSKKNQDKKTSGERAKDKNRIKQYLINQCYDQTIADAMSESLTKFDTPFYVKSVEYKLDQENGFDMEIEFINFIELPRSLRNPTT